MTSQEAEKILEDAVAKLGEHFDAVQILGGWVHEDGTSCCSKRGGGLWHARIGMAHEFISMNVADDQAVLIAEKINLPEDGENWK